MNPKKSLLILLFAGIIFLSVIFSVRSGERSAQLNVDVAPSGSSVKLNGKGIREGVSKLKPGKYEVSFSHQGFKTISQKIELSKDEKRYIGIALVSDSPSTADWYKKFPADAKKSEAISSKSFDQSTSLKAKSSPLLKELPYIDRYFRVDYGPGVKSKDPATSTAIYIRASSPENRQMALSWIRQQGFDPIDYEIIFKSFDNPFAGGD